MNYLLDTHAFLWFVNDDSSLNTLAKTLIEDPENTIYLSVASVWEMAIKISLVN
jgi:PIN domain nuclease of toxin-antitoxin system